MVSVHRWSGDLVATAGLAVLAGVVVLEGGAVPHPVRVVAVLPLLLFLPGYALVSLLYPEASGADPSTPGVGVLERVALAVALSVAAVPTVALVANLTPYGIRAEPIAVGVTALTVASALFALVARLRVPAGRRFGMVPAGWVEGVDRRFFPADDRDRGASSPFGGSGPRREVAAVTGLSLLVLLASVVFAVTVPTPPANDATFTEFYLLAENESGELVAEGFPRTFEQGETRPVHVAIANHEKRTQTYTTVILVERVAVDDGQMRVVETREVDRFRTTVPAGETVRVERSIRAALDGENVRVTFLLYRGDAPGNPSRESAYRSARLWIDVGGNESEGQVAPPAADGR